MRPPRSILRSPKTIPLIAVCCGCVVCLVLFVFQLLARQPHTVVKKINYTQLHEASNATPAAASLSIEGEIFTIAEQDGTLAQAIVTNGVAQQTVIDAFAKNNVPVEFRSLQPGPLATALNWLVPLLTIIALGFVGWRLSTSMSGRGGDLQITDQQDVEGVTFANVAGIDEAKAELAETIEFLRDPAKFGRLGGRAPRGILLSGPRAQAKRYWPAPRRTKPVFLSSRSAVRASKRSSRASARRACAVSLRARASLRRALSLSTRSMAWGVNAVEATTRRPPMEIKRSINYWSRWTASIN